MKTQTRILIIFLAVIALIAFNMTTVSFAKQGGGGGDRAGDRSGGDRGDRGGSRGGDRSGGGAGDVDSGSGSADRGARAAGDQVDNENGETNRGRNGFRSPRGGRHGGGMGGMTAEEAAARAQDRAESVFDNLDTNDDGVIDTAELNSAADERAQDMYDRLADRFGEVDTDGDGEMDGVTIAPDTRMADRLGDLAGEDGVLTADELAASFTDRLSEFDTDTENDGITLGELTDGMIENAIQRFNEKDTNGDGVLNRDDRITEDIAEEEPVAE